MTCGLTLSIILTMSLMKKIMRAMRERTAEALKKTNELLVDLVFDLSSFQYFDYQSWSL